MLVIRFSRVGKKNRAQFRIVAQEHTVDPQGRHVDILGSWDPHLKKGVFKKDRIKHWLEKGAQLSDSVYNLLVSQSIIEGKKRPVKISTKNSKQSKGEKEKKEDKKEEVKKEKESGKEDVGEKTIKEEKEEKKERPTEKEEKTQERKSESEGKVAPEKNIKSKGKEEKPAKEKK